MKKIFLTSGVIFCMMCPAFAALQNGDIDTTNGNVLYGSNPVKTANCSYPTLQKYSGTVEFEPVWEAREYTVTYNAGAHARDTYTNNIIGTDTATYNEDYALPSSITNVTGANDFAAPGYTFVGWTTNSTPSFTGGVLDNQFNGYTPWTRETGLTVYAAYTADSFAISYNCGAGVEGTASVVSGNPADTDVVMDGGYTLASGDVCTLNGYTFAGWDCPNLTGTPTVAYTDYDDSESTIFASGAEGSYNYAGSVTCTAKWTQNPIGLVWYNDTGNEATAMQVQSGANGCTYDDAITLPESEPTKNGYWFKGWRVKQTVVEEPVDE